MDRKRVNRIIKTITIVGGAEFLFVCDVHNHEWRGHAPLSWSEIFLDCTFWISLIINNNIWLLSGMLPRIQTGRTGIQTQEA